ncbi:MAG: ABC transporter substrate-binding protein [Candidatus Thorarchaeota archaeon]
MSCKHRLAILYVLITFLLIIITPTTEIGTLHHSFRNPFTQSQSWWTRPEMPNNDGPYVDKIVYKIIEGNYEQQIAVLTGEVDVMGDFGVSAEIQYDWFSDCEASIQLKNGYEYITINCAKYPYNITAFRRACAFALDKQYLCDDAWDGLAVPLDSCVPRCSPFSIEDSLPYSYYEVNIELGNELLDDAGFIDTDSDSYREAPDGSEFTVELALISDSDSIVETGNHFMTALGNLGIDAYIFLDSDSTILPDRLYQHLDYDMAVFETSFDSFDVDWLAYEFWSNYSDEPYFNLPNWENALYDSWRDQLLHATDYVDVYEAATEMQRIWTYECPQIVCSEQFRFSLHRTDKFEGHVSHIQKGVPCWWTNYKIHLMESEEGPWGGTFRWSTPADIDTFNFMNSSSSYSWDILQMLYDSLLIQGPDGNLYPWLAWDYIIETHMDNPDIPANHTRIKFDLIQNATWTDGTPLTAEDVAFSINYYHDALGNPFSSNLSEMTVAYAPSSYEVIIEFTNETYWHLGKVALKPILPSHVFSEIGLDGWDEWDPHPPDEPMVTSGPFNVSDYIPGEYIELTWNPMYHFQPYVEPPIIPRVELDGPSDITYIEGETGNTIEWHLDVNETVEYSIWRNGTQIREGHWTSGPITVSVDGLIQGVYEYLLTTRTWYVKDLGHEGLTYDFVEVDDSVIVRVIDWPSSTTFPTSSTSPTASTTKTQAVFDWTKRYLGLTILDWFVTIPSVSIIIIILVKWRWDIRKG